MKSVKFPHPIRFGSCLATIYRAQNKGYASFTVVHYDANNARQRLTFSTFETAKEEAERLLRDIVQGCAGASILRDAGCGCEGRTK